MLHQSTPTSFSQLAFTNSQSPITRDFSASSFCIPSGNHLRFGQPQIRNSSKAVRLLIASSGRHFISLKPFISKKLILVSFLTDLKSFSLPSTMHNDFSFGK
ncbi:hypothetical protein Hanom_Chr07g00646261 [Helianthus anomalus]